MIGYALCGSFCTHKASLLQLEALVREGIEVLPIMSEIVYSTSTRFGDAEALIRRTEELCGRRVIHTIVEAEPLGPSISLDAMIICPCTGNTLAKISCGITDSTVTMAAKAHLRSDRPLLIALASNDGLSQNLKNLGSIASRRAVYLVPMRQDDPIGKPHSLVADFARVPEALGAMRQNKQLRPLFL